MKGIFITGTDTGVGKTVAAAALMCRYRNASALRYWKPIQTGIELDDDTEMVRQLAACGEQEIFARGIRLLKPVSPHLAACWAGIRIDLAELAALPDNDDAAWIVEGAGGVLVPINETQMMADWITLLDLPVVIVARSGLGTINHTLLTLEALHSREIPVAGVLLNGEPNADNRAAIEHYGRVPVVGELPKLGTIDHVTLTASSHRLDPSGLLREFLR
jgi:dethiobiotin synthase